MFHASDFKCNFYAIFMLINMQINIQYSVLTN